jgi:ankyrin repeat protein
VEGARQSRIGAIQMTISWESAVCRGDAQAVREQVAAGADLNARDRYGQTGLMLAAHAGHAEVVDVLIDAGADLDHAAKFTLTALMLAVVAGHRAVAARLAAAGANLAVQGSGAPGFAGKTAADLAHDRGDVELAAALRTRAAASPSSPNPRSW